MIMDVLRFEYEKGVRFIYPAHPMVKNWRFEDGQEAEAKLCHAMAVVAEKNGMSGNDLMHLFPASLRMLKSESKWA